MGNPLTAANILVLVNNTELSSSVADYYMTARSVPLANRLDVEFRVTRNTNIVWPFPTWDEQEALWDEIDAYITAQGLDIRCILLMPDFSVSAVNKDASGDPIPPESEERISLDSWLCHRSRGFPLSADEAYWIWNPWYVWLHKGQTAIQNGEDSLETEKIEHYTQGRQATMGLTDEVQEPDANVRGMILTMRLDGPSEALIKGMIDNAIAAEAKQLPGTWYFDYATLDTLGLSPEALYANQSAHWPPAAAIGESLGRSVVEETSGSRLWEFNDGAAGLYLGWYTWPADASIPTSRSWEPGAIGIEVSMWSMLWRPEAGPPWRMGLWDDKSYVGNMITEGVTATFGDWAESGWFRIYRGNELLQLLSQGLSWVEAYWAQNPLSRAGYVAIGDPLYRPFINLRGWSMSSWATTGTALAVPTDLAMTFAELIDQVEVIAGCTAAQALVALRSGYRRFLTGVAAPGEHAHPWSFLTEDAQLTIGEAVTGTATGTAGGVVTATTAIFDESMVGLIMTISDTTSRTCEITKFTSETVVETSDRTGFTSKTVSVAATGILDAPSDFAGLVSGFTYAYGQGTSLPELRESTPKRILEMWRDDSLTQEPFWWALKSKTFTAATGQRWEFAFAPIPDEERVLNYRYRVDAAVPTDSSNYPLGGPDMSEPLLACALAAAEVLYGKLTNGPHEMNAQARMLAAIRADQTFYRKSGKNQSTEG